MLRSLNSGVSGIQQFQGRLDVIGNNIANSNTIAYKTARADFADAFSQTLKASSTGTAGMQIGSGVATSAIKNNFTQGAPTSTGVKTDLYISGEGFFMVQDPVSGVEYATRAGDFKVDSSGYLVTNTGLRVQGFANSGLATRGDLQIDGSGRPATSDPNASFLGYSIDNEGRINVYLSDNTEFVRGQVLLQTFRDPQALLKEGDNLYSGISAAGPLGGNASPQAEAPGTNGLGRVQAGALELSNVDLANEFASLITTQRGFQASARIITTSDEVLQELVNMKR
ncbi:MAG: flagellar hook-basal body complex protein [Verrucomicrobia bacterium]|nr:flagellar hook-basal body complex protein [Verrucomicrobiota bacterium]